MWRKRRSALFMDFENVRSRVSPEIIEALTAWLEDGRFDEAGGKRKLVTKKIYWNSSDEKHREAFEAAGFEVVLCEKFSSMKNGADIRMALDILDTCWREPEIKEYILFTTDSDFVPVLQRLSEKSKLSAILVNETRMDAHTAFNIFADVLIPLRHLKSEGLTYKRPDAGLLRGLRKKAAPDGPVRPPGKTAPAAAPKGPPAQGTEASKVKAADQSLLAQAERAVVRVASRTPKTYVTRKAIEGQLRQIKGFKKNGADAYLGKQHYQGLMMEIGKRDKRVKVLPGRGQSASVMYVPDS
jgi:uncharacterized LabA/DUF88 family protein